MGANVPGKPRVFLPYVGGVDAYRRAATRSSAGDYLGFERRGPSGTQRNDGVVRRLQPDVAMMLDMIDARPAAAESMSPAEARAFWKCRRPRPPGPDVGEIVDGTLPGAGGDLAYRLYRPPRPVRTRSSSTSTAADGCSAATTSDDPFCRDLCVRTDAVVVSVNYRHAPEDRFPAAADDAFAAVRWIADHAAELGGDTGQLAVAGWSAGGNLAAVVCQLARDAGGPDIVGQLLVTPVTDADLTRPSYPTTPTGYILTAADGLVLGPLRRPRRPRDPRASPLRADRWPGCRRRSS